MHNQPIHGITIPSRRWIASCMRKMEQKSRDRNKKENSTKNRKQTLNTHTQTNGEKSENENVAATTYQSTNNDTITTAQRMNEKCVRTRASNESECVQCTIIKRCKTIWAADWKTVNSSSVCCTVRQLVRIWVQLHEYVWVNWIRDSVSLSFCLPFPIPLCLPLQQLKALKIHVFTVCVCVYVYYVLFQLILSHWIPFHSPISLLVNIRLSYILSMYGRRLWFWFWLISMWMRLVHFASEGECSYMNIYIYHRSLSIACI